MIVRGYSALVIVFIGDKFIVLVVVGGEAVMQLFKLLAGHFYHGVTVHS